MIVRMNVPRLLRQAHRSGTGSRVSNHGGTSNSGSTACYGKLPVSQCNKPRMAAETGAPLDMVAEAKAVQLPKELIPIKPAGRLVDR